MKDGWEYIDFKDVFPVKMGKTPPRGDKASWDVNKETQNKWVSIADISSNEGKVIQDTKEYISDSAAKKIFKVSKGSLLMSFKLSIGRMAFAGDDLYTNEAIIAIPESDRYLLRFLFYYLSSYDWLSLTEGNEKVKGATLNKTSIGTIQLPVLSLEQQQTIVDSLDSSFAKIDAMKVNAAKALEEAKALFQASLKSLLEPKDGWKEKSVGQLAVDMYRGAGVKKDQVTKEGISCVRYGEIYTKYNYHFDTCHSHTQTEYVPSPKYFEHGDIIFAITGESVEDIGKCAAYTGDEKCIAGGDTVVLKHNQEPRYLAYALSTPSAIKQKGHGKTKLKVVHTNIPSLKTIVLPIAPMDEQKAIADTLDTIQAKFIQLQANYDKICQECVALKQAVLKQVFE